MSCEIGFKSVTFVRCIAALFVFAGAMLWNGAQAQVSSITPDGSNVAFRSDHIMKYDVSNESNLTVDIKERLHLSLFRAR